MLNVLFLNAQQKQLSAPNPPFLLPPKDSLYSFLFPLLCLFPKYLWACSNIKLLCLSELLNILLSPINLGSSEKGSGAKQHEHRSF